MPSAISLNRPTTLPESSGYVPMTEDNPPLSKISPIGTLKSKEISKTAAVFIVFSSLVLIFIPRFFPKYTRDDREEATSLHFKIHLVALFVWTCCVLSYGYSLKNN